MDCVLSSFSFEQSIESVTQIAVGEFALKVVFADNE